MVGRKGLVVRPTAGSCERTVCRFYSNITDFWTGGILGKREGEKLTSIALFEVFGGDAGIAYSSCL